MSRVVPQLQCPIDIHLLKEERSAPSSGTPAMPIYIRTDNTAEDFDQWYQWKDYRFAAKGVKETKLRPLTGKKSSEYWTEFQICAVVSTGEPRIICVYDRQTLKWPAIDGTSAMKKHCTTNATHSQKKGSKNQEAAVQGMDVREGLARQGIQALQVTPRQKRQDLPYEEHYSKETFQRYLTQGFVTANIPFVIVENLEIRRVFLHTGVPKDDIPSRTTLRLRLDAEYFRAVASIIAKLPKDRKISLALDGWTSPNNIAIMAVLAYYLDENWRMKELLISFNQLRGEHSGSNMARHLIRELKHFGLDHPRRLLGITMDSASNNSKMTAELTDMLAKLVLDERGHVAAQLEEFPDIEDVMAAVDAQIAREAPAWDGTENRIRCMAHILQICLAAFFKRIKVGGRRRNFMEEERAKDQEAEDHNREVRRNGRGKAKLTRVEKVGAMPNGFNKIVEKQRQMAVGVKSSPQRAESYLDTQEGEDIAVTLILDVLTRWNSLLFLLERAYRCRSFTEKWLSSSPSNAKYASCLATDEEWRAIEYLIKILRPIRYWTMIFQTRRRVTLNYIITVYNDVFDHFDSVLDALKSKKAQWQIDLREATQAARTVMMKYYDEIRPGAGTLIILAHILDPFRKIKVFKKWDIREGGKPDDEDSYTAQNRQVFLDYFEKHYASKLQKPTSTRRTAASGLQVPSLSRAESTGTDLARRLTGMLADSSDEEDGDEYGSRAGESESTVTKSEYDLAMECAINYVDSATESPREWFKTPVVSDDTPIYERLAYAATYTPPDPCIFWKAYENFPHPMKHLAEMAKDIYSVQSNASGPEGSFSIGRAMINANQARMKADKINKQAVVKADLIDNRELHILNDEESVLRQENKKLQNVAHFKDATYVDARIREGIHERLQRKHPEWTEKERDRRIACGDITFVSEGSGEEGDWDEFDHNGVNALNNISNVRLSRNESGTALSNPFGVQETQRLKRVHRRNFQIRRVDRPESDTEAERGEITEHEDIEDSQPVVFVDSDADDEEEDEVAENLPEDVQQLLDSNESASRTRSGKLRKMPESFTRRPIRHIQKKNATAPPKPASAANLGDRTRAKRGRESTGTAAPQGKRPNSTNGRVEAETSAAGARKAGRPISAARKKSNNKGKQKAGAN